MIPIVSNAKFRRPSSLESVVCRLYQHWVDYPVKLSLPQILLTSAAQSALRPGNWTLPRLPAYGLDDDAWGCS